MLKNLQKVVEINRRFIKKRKELFQPLLDAISRFETDHNFVPLADDIQNVFTEWYPGQVPSLSDVETDKSVKKMLKSQINIFVTEIREIASITPFWSKNLKKILELMYLPTKKTFFYRISQFFSRWPTL
jgi:Zn-dependent M32 family carboxypeptidase